MRIFILANLAVFLLLLTFGTCTEIDKSWIENVLKLDENLTRVKEVLSVKSSTTLPNETPLGNDTRITMEVMLGNGLKTTKSVIMKSEPNTPDLNEKYSFVKTEIMAYKLAFSEMEKILNEFDDENEILWPRVLHVRDYDQLVLEDVVGEQGYIPGNKSEGLDLKHSKLAIKGVAKIHALTAVVNEFNNTLEQEFPRSHLEIDIENVKHSFEEGLKNLAKLIETKWGKEWSPYAEKLRRIAPHSAEKVKKLTEEKDGFINVLNIASPEIRAIYFKYSISELQKFDFPIALKITNFQLAYWNTPAHDLQFFFNTSPNLQVMTTHREEVLKEYFQSFVHYLIKFNFKGELPNYDDFLKDMERNNLEGMNDALLGFYEIYTKAIENNDPASAKYEEIIKVLLKKAVDDKVL